MNDISIFESIKHIDETSREYWLARELSKALQYKDYRNFELTIFKAMDACKNSGFDVLDHFGEITEMVSIGSGARRGFPSYILSRYACNLTVQNGDPMLTSKSFYKYPIRDCLIYYGIFDISL